MQPPRGQGALQSAHTGGAETLGESQHTKTLELLAECTQCRDFPSKSAVTLLLTALKELPPDDPRIALRLRLAHQCAIFIGDESPTEAQSFLEEAYRPFAESPKVEPLQHVRIRNSLAVFGLRFSENTALATWQGAREILNRAGLGNLQEAVRLDANIASSIAKRNPAEAAAMAKSIFIRQLNEFGIDHHLALWAAMDYLQYALSAGLWREAFELLAVHLARLQWPEPLSGGNLFENRLSPKAPYGFTAPLPLSNHEAVWSLERIHHIESVTLPSIIKGVGPCPPTVTPEDEVMVTRILLELLKFRMWTDGIAFFVIDRFLKRRYRLRGIDWLALTDTMRRYYLRFSGCTDRSWSSRRAMRRLARASLGNPSILERLFLKKTCARHGLPTTDL